MIKEKEEVYGIIPATMSILKSDLTLDNEKTLQHAENLLESGSNFVVFFGSTGQSQLLSSGEKRQFIQYCAQSKYKKRFIIGTFYLSHWFLVIPWVTIKMSIFPKKILWRKTLHTGV